MVVKSMAAQPTPGQGRANFFGQRIPPMAEMLSSPKLRVAVAEKLAAIIQHADKEHISSTSAVLLADQIAGLASSNSEHDYESKARKVLADAGLISSLASGLSERAQLVSSQIMPHIQGVVLDFGCGDGRIGELLEMSQQRPNVVLADVYKHDNIGQCGLPFFLTSELGPVYSGIFHTILLLTVLHHSDNPSEVLKQVKRLLKPEGKVIVIESVYGMQCGEYAGLDAEEQRLLNIFFVHFYNRVIHFSEDPAGKVNLPYNFLPWQDWNALFTLHQFEVMRLELLGVDLPFFGPEFHTMHILRHFDSKNFQNPR